MATVRGVGGDVDLPAGFNAKLSGFSFNLEIKTVDTTGFGDEGWMTEEPVCQRLSGSATGTPIFNVASSTPVPAAIMDSTPDANAATGSIVLTFAPGCTWTFNGTINQVSGDRGACEKGNITYNFLHAGGGVVQVWDEMP